MTYVDWIDKSKPRHVDLNMTYTPCSNTHHISKMNFFINLSFHNKKYTVTFVPKPFFGTFLSIFGKKNYPIKKRSFQNFFDSENNQEKRSKTTENRPKTPKNSLKRSFHNKKRSFQKKTNFKNGLFLF